jgi:hypothetical protein
MTMITKGYTGKLGGSYAFYRVKEEWVLEI